MLDEQPQAPEEYPSILDENLEDVDISRPIIRGGIVHPFSIKNVELQDNKAGTGKNLLVTLATTGKVPSTTGEELDEGFPMYHYIPLTSVTGRPGKKDYTDDDVRRSLARFTLAVHGAKVPVMPLDRHLGKIVNCKVSISKPTPEYPHEGNNLTFIAPTV